MKKYLKASIIMLLALFFTACGNGGGAKAETSTYTVEIEGATMEAIFTHEGDKLIKVDQKMDYPYSYFGYEDGYFIDDETKEALEERVRSMYEAYEDGEGTSMDMKFTDTTLLLTMSVDLEKADASTLGLAVSDDSDNVSFKKTVEDFEAQGFTKKK
ncbi:DUF1307 domain-containing protein [Enterococcus sp. CWB-B31]|uniref:DUF1307 domain-containing protein n=1 Tax=Enterococcus sp. CWB-B31 TaxID=2885159 RepID=UPI001E47A0CF|nr:DUF1307 domain-containing protein [Enterococcus sp. CWB-B31]MCB5955451.1 YehR family protein [Enterococcus sp. CWB-B31]